MIDAAGQEGTAYAHGVSSGGALLLRAAAAGVPVARVSVLEPPYRVEGAPPAPERYTETLQGFVDAGDRSGLVEYFQTRVVGLPAEVGTQLRGTPMWHALEEMAPTLRYDGLAMGGDDHSLPVDLLSRVDVPVLAVTSTGTALPWMGRATEELAAALPSGEFARLAGGFHEVPVEVLAPALADFYRRG